VSSCAVPLRQRLRMENAVFHPSVSAIRGPVLTCRRSISQMPQPAPPRS
jgi:hypothetical protein